MYGSEEDRARARSFSVFALALLGAGAAMHLLSVKIWPWWLYGIGGFVLFQGMLKWLWSTHRYCPKCLHTMSVWPWTREQGGSRKAEGGSANPAAIPHVVVARRYTGGTIEEALRQFEDACSQENFQKVVIQETIKHAAGTLVRYEVRWKYSVFDDDNSGFHESWALLAPADPAEGDPPDSRFRVVSATAEHHNL